MKKFELTSEFTTNIFGTKLFRIKALVDFGDVKAGELGGYLEKEENLDHDGDAWVYGNARVSGDARVFGDAYVSGNAWVYGDARVFGDAWVFGDARVFGDAYVFGNARVYGDACVSGNARVFDNARVSGNACVSGNARVFDNAWVYGDACVYGNADYAYAHGFGSVNRTTTFFRLNDGGVGVRCGCFYGTLDEFREKVRETHKESNLAQEYMMLADLMEMRFQRREE